eukprot:TRINITY_DN26642_c0_g1_i1.p1 TRINITY_DN26642_c0_g1~~TRINITY_DN26642_c0_g1_i1.p1  ORF type:complete len:148 (+),score=35.40 TRINITY_DN26642_c0_g1_i1:79-522(+)
MSQRLAVWYIRMLSTVMIFQAIMQFANDTLQNGWDENMGKLDKKTKAIARMGVLWDHFFQGQLFLMALLVSEYGGATVRKIVLGLLAVAFFPLAGVATFLLHTDAVDYDPKKRTAEIVVASAIGLFSWMTLAATYNSMDEKSTKDWV